MPAVGAATAGDSERTMASGQLRRRSPSERPRRPRPSRSGRRSDLGSRVLVAVPALAAAVFLVARGGVLFALALLILGWVCLDELYRLTARAHPAKLAGFVALLALLLAAHYGTRDQVLLVAVAALPAAFLMTLAAPRGSMFGVTVTLLGVWWVGLAMAHAVLLRALPHGGGIFIDVLVGTFVGDTGAYLGGRSFGRRQLAPRISPNKTVEGLVIGAFCAIVAVWFASLYQPWFQKGDAVLLGVGVAIAAPIGDLFESYIKREAGVKDSGRAFGAHGGALDRLDAVLFTTVVGYYVWLAILTHG
jgi:phosphatidate cytidylyltransferase